MIPHNRLEDSAFGQRRRTNFVASFVDKVRDKARDKDFEPRVQHSLCRTPRLLLFLLGLPLIAAASDGTVRIAPALRTGTANAFDETVRIAPTLRTGTANAFDETVRIAAASRTATATPSDGAVRIAAAVRTDTATPSNGLVRIAPALLTDTAMPSNGTVRIAPALRKKPAPASAWSVRVGPAWRTGNQLQVGYDPAAVIRGVHSRSVSSGSPGSSAAVGPDGQYADRNYNDGFVHTDPGTADPETDTVGLTWNWGYGDSGQYDGSAISFHADGASSVSDELHGLAVSPEQFDEDFSVAGLLLGIGRTFWNGKTLVVGLAFDVAWYQPEDREFSTAATPIARRTVTTTSGQITDRYEVNNYTPPDAPYAGNAEGPGPLLRNIPDSRSETSASASRSAAWRATSSAEIEISQSELALGPWLAWSPVDRLSLRLAPQVVLARVCLDVDARTRYNPASTQFADFETRDETTDWIFGAGIAAGLRIDVYKGWSVGCDLSATWWADDVEVRAEPFTAKVELGSWRAVASIGWSF